MNGEAGRAAAVEIDGVQLDRWIVYHAAQNLVRYADLKGDGRGEVPDLLVCLVR